MGNKLRKILTIPVGGMYLSVWSYTRSLVGVTLGYGYGELTFNELTFAIPAYAPSFYPLI